MEENLIGYLLGSLDQDVQREVAAYLAIHPEEQTKLDLLHQVVEPLSADRDESEPPAELALRTISHVAEHIVATEGSVADPSSQPVMELFRTLRQNGIPAPERPAAACDAALPTYPKHGNEATPMQYRRRNVFAAFGLSAAMVLIALTAVSVLRQHREVAACANNMRSISRDLDLYCNTNNGQFPQVAANESVQSALQRAGLVPHDSTFTCPGAHSQPAAPNEGVIDYAYSLGYRDDKGQLWGLTRGGESDQFPILADAPERRNSSTVPMNHRKGQNVLFIGGHVRFCTNPFVGPEVGGKGDDIYFNTAYEAHAGTHQWDSVLGRAHEEP